MPAALDAVRFAQVLALVPAEGRLALLEQLSADVRAAAAEVARAWTVPPDWPALRRPCHRLAGLAGTIGAQATREAAARLEEAARLRDPAAAAAAHDRLTRAEAALLAEIGAARHRAAARA